MKSWKFPWPNRWRYALSAKLILLFVGMALLFAMIVGLGLSYVFKSHFENHVRPHLVQYLEYVQHDIGMPPNRQRAKTLADKLNIQIQIIDDRGAWSSHNELVELDNLKVEHRIVENGKEYIFAKGNHREYFLTHQENVTLLFDVPNVRQGKKGFRSFIPIGVVLLTLLLLYFATRRLFFPLTTIQAGVKRFAAGDLDHRISVNRRDELGDLANSVNAMASEIQQMLDAKRQLLLAISHELRTPLTRAKVALELLDETSLKKQLGDDIKAMEKLIEEIIETERLSSRHGALNKESKDLVAVIQELIDDFYADAGLDINLPEQPVILELDVARLKLLLKNLIDNSLRHTPVKADPPAVTLTQSRVKVEIEVEDRGVGVDAEHLPHLTEPFYRVDPARQRSTGGYGLGLYLCQMIVDAHQGSLLIESKMGKGTKIVVALPR